MAKRTKKTRKVDESTAPPEPVESELDEAPAPKMKKKASASVPQVKTHFKARLLKGPVTYEYAGLVFQRGVTRDVPRKFLEQFKANGFFSIAE